VDSAVALVGLFEDARQGDEPRCYDSVIRSGLTNLVFEFLYVRTTPSDLTAEESVHRADSMAADSNKVPLKFQDGSL
jgi:hypothetical protein